MIGPHASLIKGDINSLNQYYKYFDCVQIFLGSPKTFKVTEYPSYKPPLNKVLVVHSSFCVSLIKDDAEHYVKSLSHLVRLSFQADNVGAQFIVTHVGAIIQGQSKSAQEVLYNFCMDWIEATNNHKTILCLECDPGSKKGTKKGSLSFLFNFVSRLNHPRVKICFDTEHAYANGFNLNSKQVDYLLDSKVVSVIHLNSIPQEVELGSHLDRHTNTLIEEGKETDKIKYIYSKARELNIPCILERDINLVNKDIKYLGGVRYEL